MNDPLLTLHGCFQRKRVQKIPVKSLDRQLVQTRSRALGILQEDRNLIVSGKEFPHEVVPQEAVGTGDKDFHCSNLH